MDYQTDQPIVVQSVFQVHDVVRLRIVSMPVKTPEWLKSMLDWAKAAKF